MTRNKLKKNLLLLLLLTVLFAVLLEKNLNEKSVYGRLGADTVSSDGFREMQMTEKAVEKMKKLDPADRGTAAGIYYLQKKGSTEKELLSLLDEKKLEKAGRSWKKRTDWKEYQKMCNAIWNDLVYFPVPVSGKHESYTVNFVDSWMGERTYGGRRGHEGTDIMASENTPGLYPVVSMSDGTVASKGWLEKGGWRLGISSPSGGYYYYAHLASYADLEVGDSVSAGEVIGFMGNSGYGPEGTTGMFATHLHVGIYIYPDGKETSINPYWVLRFLEEKKLSCSF